VNRWVENDIFRCSPSPINGLMLDILLKVSRDGFNTKMLTGFKLETLAGLTYTLALCSTKGKNPLQKHYCVTQHCQYPCTKFTGIQLTWQIGEFKNELWLWSCLLKQTQLQQCSNISNDNFRDISLIITITGQHGVKKDLRELRTNRTPTFHLYA
jgi:hypothetical protein